MGAQRSSVVRRGSIAGVLAATTVVLFFLVVDLLGGQALQTPTFLSSVLLGTDAEAGSPGVGGLVLYTLLHYAVFVAVGIAVAWALDRAHTPAALVLGLVVGFLLFDIVFYASISITGVDVVQELGWPSFLAGNLLAGLVLVGYLGATGTQRRRSWGDALRENAVLREGLVAGLIGAIVLAGFFFILDLTTGRLLFTPAALGSALFQGAGEAGAVEVTAATVFGYTLVHVAAFLVAGLAVSALVAQSEQHPSLLLALVLLFVTFQTLVIGLLAIVAAWLLDQLAWWAIAVGNLLAAAAMGYYLWKRHPRLAHDLDRAEQVTAAGSRHADPAPTVRAGL